MGSQPVHVLYGGAHLFREDTCRKMGGLAERALAEYAPDPAALALAVGIPSPLAETVYARVVEKLQREPVEDFRVDFEDGFGRRSDEEEDAAADSAASETAAAVSRGALPRSFGIRIKALDEAGKARGLRTLQRFLDALLSRTGGRAPENFLVTLPKITAPEQVGTLADALDPFPEIGIEIMVETPQALLALPKLIEAARGRCLAAHFGAYDYTASLGITGARQELGHPACDFARSWMQLHLAGSGIWLADGATTILPIPVHRGAMLSSAQIAENRAAVWRGWTLHYEAVRRSLDCGFYQSWDLHPAQLPARYAAVYTFFLEGIGTASRRLRNFISEAARASQTGGMFDDAATGRGLVNYFLRAVSCGAIPESDLHGLTSLKMEELSQLFS